MNLNKTTLLIAAIVLKAGSLAAADVAVTTWHNNNGRTAANGSETILNTSNVHTGTFGKLFSLPVDAQIYAQPLYVPNLTIPNKGVHNVLFVATQNNSVYAFDADSASAQPLWQVNLGTPVPSSQDIYPQIGILSTPVIDINRQAIYLVTETSTLGTIAFSLHALDLTTGREKVASPVLISGQVPGNGAGASSGVLAFSAADSLQRPALLELNGNIYIGFGSHGDQGAYHGWIFGYDGVTMRRIAIKCLSPNGYGSAVWQSGGGLAADSDGNVYLATGNGNFDGVSDYGDSVIKMHVASGLGVTSYFTPATQAYLEYKDLDLGAGAAMVIPGSALLVSPMVITGGKDGNVYLLNSGTLGGYNSTDSVVQKWAGSWGHFGGYVYYNNMLYTAASTDLIRFYSFSGTAFTFTAASATAPHFWYSNSPAMSLSANGLTPGTAILWTANSTRSSDGGNYPGILRAYDGVTAAELWNSDSLISGADSAGAWAKFTPPTIANGKVYLATFDSGVSVYGLKP